MTQVKLWQIVSQTANAIIFSDADGNLKSLPAGTAGQVLVAGPDGAPMWSDDTALATALQAKTDAASAIATAKAYTEAQIAALVDNAPVALNTLNELAVKLNGEDSAINALLLQVDGKAEKTEVVTQIAQAKQDAIQTSQSYVDNAIGNVQANMDSALAGVRGDVISYADQTASFKSANAKMEAISEANDFATQSIAQALLTASDDATAKSDAVKESAVNEAKAYTDGEVANALNIAGNDAQDKANAAQTAAADDASTKVAGLRDAIPGTFWVEGTSTACFLASAKNLDRVEATGSGLMVTDRFTEITGAAVIPNDPFLNAKLLFVNGVAMSDEWAAKKVGNGQLQITMSERLAQHVFDGTENSVMLLVEYKSYNPITLKS